MNEVLWSHEPFSHVGGILFQCTSVCRWACIWTALPCDATHAPSCRSSIHSKSITGSRHRPSILAVADVAHELIAVSNTCPCPWPCHAKRPPTLERYTTHELPDRLSGEVLQLSLKFHRSHMQEYSIGDARDKSPSGSKLCRNNALHKSNRQRIVNQIGLAD